MSVCTCTNKVLESLIVGKMWGRLKGTLNKATAELKECLTLLLESNFDTIQSDLNTLEPKDRIKTILEISKFVIPTLKSVDHQIETDLQNLKFDFEQEVLRVVIVLSTKED